MENTSDVQYIKPLSAVTDQSLITGIDQLLDQIDSTITQYQQMLDQLDSMQNQLGDVGRQLKASEALASGKVTLDESPDGDYYMDSFSDPSLMYEVSWVSCTCKDHVYRKKDCKHIIAFRNLSDSRKLADLEAEAKQARADLGL